MNNLIFLLIYILVIYFGFNIRNAGRNLNSIELLSAGKVWLFTIAVLTISSLYDYFSTILELCTFSNLSGKINCLFEPIVNEMVTFIFWDPIKAMGFNVGADVPIVVVWLVFGAVYFTFRMKFINFRGFKHAIGLVKGDYDDPNDKGEVSHFQAYQRDGY